MRSRKQKLAYYKKWRLLNKENIIKKYKEKHALYPWKRILQGIKQRCNNPKNNRYADWGGRGIKCLITEEELKELWFRDKAYLMKKPSIDRKDNNKNYTLDNCQFIEFAYNSGKDKNKPILQFSLNNIFIKEWENAIIINKILGFSNSYIDSCARGVYKQAYGFIWKFKEK